jgi:endonuclease YncB( thermonuclease family)
VLNWPPSVANYRPRYAACARYLARLQQAKRPHCWLAFAAIALLLAWPVAAQSVIDGDSLIVDGTTYRLHGIDAPDPDQICADGWPAGYAAEEYLGELTEGKQITCMPTTGQRNDETVAICRADGVDLSAAMVTGGHALAFVPYSARYIKQEAAAVNTGRGVHAHKCVAPWKWRARLNRVR